MTTIMTEQEGGSGSSTVIDTCLGVNGEGVEFHEFSCTYPQLDGYYARYGSP